MRYTPRLPHSNVNVSETSAFGELFILTASVMGFLAVCYLLLGFLLELLIPHISHDLEKKLFSLLRCQFSSGQESIAGKLALQRILEKVKPCAPDLPYDFEIHVRESSTVNALALPGGHMIFFTGLLEKVRSENELAFVLSHELGHYVHRDHLRGLGRAFALIALSSMFLGVDNDVSKMFSQGLAFSEMSFSRRQEAAADELAMETVQCAYGHVSGAADFFQRIPLENDPGRFGHYFSSHPDNNARIDRLQELSRLRGYSQGEKTPFVFSSRGTTPVH